jgi:hypothetical protein
MSEVKDLEDELEKIYDDGVSPYCKFFRDKLSRFKLELEKIYLKKEKDITNILWHKITKECDKKIIDYIRIHNGCVITTSKIIRKETGIDYFKIRLIFLETNDIIKLKTFERTRILFFHEKVLK